MTAGKEYECVIIDYGMGNLASIANMMRRIGSPHVVTCDPRRIEQASCLILPGVGAFAAGVRNLEARGLDVTIKAAVMDRGIPILGICLGMHLLTRASEEGSGQGLALVAADCVKFRPCGSSDRRIRIPHMGWNVLRPKPETALYRGWEGEARFYFVHSYYVVCDDPGIVASETDYGTTFASSIEHGRVFGVQFHPEKSHRFGLRLLQRFVGLGRE